MRSLWSEDSVTTDELMGDEVPFESATSAAYLEDAERRRQAVERAEDDAYMPLLPDPDDLDASLDDDEDDE